MKQKLILLLLLFCSLSAFGAPVTLEQAMKSAKDFMSARGKSLSFTTTKSRVMKAPAKNGKQQNSFYILNADGGKGFVIVSADDRTPAILGYGDEGSLDLSKAPANVRWWLEGYSQTIGSLDSISAVSPLSKAPRRVKAATRNAIAPLITTLWDQATPYWNECPTFMQADSTGEQAYTGCVATAMSQIMYYHKWPKETTQEIPAYQFTYSDGNYNYSTVEMQALAATSFDWDNMLTTYTGAEAKANTDAVAHLMFYAGCAVKMQYGTSSSGAYTDDIPNAFSLLGYNSDSIKIKFRNDFTQQDWDDLVYSELAKKRPLIYNGTAGSGGGHSFICDGYAEGDYFHINWGWGGMANGYFVLSVLNPSESGIGGAGAGEGYNMKQNIITGIVPGTGSGTTTDKEAKLTATNLYFNYGSTSMTMNRDSKSAAFKLYKSKYIVTSYSDHSGSGKKYKAGIALYDETGENQVSVIGATNIYSTVTTSATGDTYKFGQSISRPSDGLAFGADLTGKYRIVPVYQVQGSDEWLPMDGSDRYYAAVTLANDEAQLTAHPISNLKADKYAFKGDSIVGSPEQVTVTITNDGPDRYYGDLYLWVDGEQIDEFGGYTTTLQAEVPAGGSTDVTFNFTPTAAGTKSVQVSTDDQGSKMLSGTSTIVITSEEVKPMNLAVAIAAEGADDDGNVYDNTVRFKVDITNKGGSTYRKYVLAPLFICSKDENGKVTGGKMVTYKQSNLKLSPGETQTLYFTFDNLAYGSTYALNIYARNENDSLKNVVKSGESKYYNICRGMTVWESDGTRYGVKASGNIVIPAEAAAVSLEGLTITSVTPNANPNCLYFIGSEEQAPTDLTGKNIIKGSKAESISLSDGYDFYTPRSVEVDGITYTRKVNRSFDGTSGWETLALPFAATQVKAGDSEVNWKATPDGEGQLWICNYTSQDDNTLYFSCAEQLQANIPYLIAVDADASDLAGKELTFSATDVTLVPDAKAITSGTSVVFEGLWVDSLEQKLFYIDETGDKLTWYTEQQVPAFRAFARGIEDGSTTDLQIVIEGLNTDGINVAMNRLKDKLYRTYSYSRDLNLPSEVKAYAVYKYEGQNETQPGKVYLRRLSYVPANMGVLLVAELPSDVTIEDTKTYNYRLTFRSEKNAIGITSPTTVETNISDRDNTNLCSLWTVSYTGDSWNNYLVPTINQVSNLGNAKVEGDKITYRYFALSEYSLTKSGKAADVTADSENNYVGFFRLTEKGSSGNNRAYLALPTDNASDSQKDVFGFLNYNGKLIKTEADDTNDALAKQNVTLLFDDVEGSTTGINSVNRENSEADEYYNLQGIRVMHPTKGIYIHQGKKVIVK